MRFTSARSNITNFENVSVVEVSSKVYEKWEGKQTDRGQITV